VALLAAGGVAATGAGWTVTTRAQAPPTDDARGRLVEQQSKFLVFLRGVPIGDETFRVARDGSEWVLSGSGRLRAPIDLTLRRGEVRYDAEMRPRRVLLEGWARERSLDLDLTIEGTTARRTADETADPDAADQTIPEGAVVLPTNFLGSYAALAVRLAGAPPGAEIPVFIAPQGSTTVVLEEARTEHLQVGRRSFPIRRHRVTFRNTQEPAVVELDTEADGRLVRLAMPGIDLQFAREDVASVAAREQQFRREGDEDVRIPAYGFSLAATVSRPATLPAAPRGQKVARLPAVVLVPGPGPVDRDYVVAGIPIFGQLAAGLADAGFLVIRYDKRGVGQSGGREEAATLADYAEDVRAVARWLDERRDVDPDRIAVVGHDEGGWIALLTASREKKVSRVVLLAAGGAKGAELVLEQQRLSLASASLTEEEKRRRVELQQQIHAALLSGGSWDGVPEDLRRQAETPMFASVLAFDPAEVLRRVRQPVLIVTAALDREIPPHHGEKLAALARARKREAGVTLETIPGVNHLLVPAGTGERDEYAKLSGESISPAVVSSIVGWLNGS
jgi:pimeloyl-ACP methyl ester carboxylesterase